MSKEEFYKYGESLGISINDLQRLKMLADNCQKDMADNKYTEADMLNCWNTLMVAMTKHNPIFFKDYINSLNKQDNEK